MGPRMAKIGVLGPSPGPVLKPQNDRIVVQIIRFPYRVLAIMTHPRGPDLGPPREPSGAGIPVYATETRQIQAQNQAQNRPILGLPGLGPRIRGPEPGPG